MGRTAYGVKGITLEEGNEVIGMETITPDSTTSIFTVTEGGYGKRTPWANIVFRVVAAKALSA